MRAVRLADIEAAARAVLLCAPDGQPALAAQLIAEANLADRYRKRLRKPHTDFGTGTLMSAASGHPQPCRLENFDKNTLDAFACVIKALQTHLDQSNLVK